MEEVGAPLRTPLVRSMDDLDSGARFRALTARGADHDGARIMTGRGESVGRGSLGPYLLLTLGIAGISTASLWARLSGASGTELAFRRLILTVPILWLFTVRRGGSAAPQSVAAGPILVSGACLAVHFAAYFASLARLESVAVTLVFVSMHPVMLFAIEHRLRRAPRTSAAERRAFAGVLLAVAGSIWLARDELRREEGDLLGIGLGLVSALGMVGYLLAGRAVAGKLLPSVYARRTYAIAAMWLGVGLFIGGGNLIPTTAREWQIAGLLALFPTVLGHTPMNAALRHLPATVISTAFLGEVVGASPLGLGLPRRSPADWLLGGWGSHRRGDSVGGAESEIEFAIRRSRSPRTLMCVTATDTRSCRS